MEYERRNYLVKMTILSFFVILLEVGDMLKTELEDLKWQNREQLFMMIKEYVVMYMKIGYFFRNSKDERKTLVENLKDYFKIIKEENRYFTFMLKHLDRITDDNELYEVLDQLDRKNSQTYHYYDGIINEYELSISLNDQKRATITKKNFSSIIDSTKYQEEIIGLFLNKDDLMNYFHEHSNVFEYLKSRTKVYNCDAEDGMTYYGVYPIIENNILTNINICVPKITNLKKLLINIHEYNHAIDLFEYLGQAYLEQDYEKSAKLEEERFLKTYIKEKQQKYFQ